MNVREGLADVTEDASTLLDPSIVSAVSALPTTLLFICVLVRYSMCVMALQARAQCKIGRLHNVIK